MIPPPNIAITVRKEKLHKKDSPDIPWPLQTDNRHIGIYMWYLVHPDASLAPNKRQIPPVNAARGETPTAVPHDPESIDDKAPPSTAPLTYITYLVYILLSY